MMNFILAAIGLIYIGYSVYSISNNKHLREMHKIDMQIERNKQVFHFRMRMMNMFHVDAIRCMPSYEEMLYSDKPLTARDFFNVDELIVKETSARGLYEPMSGTIYYHEN